MRFRWWLVGAGLLLLALGAVLAFVLLRGAEGGSSAGEVAELIATSSEIDLTMPPSMAEIAAEYPELEPILNDPELGSVYKEFLIAYQEGGMDAAVAMAEERGLLTPDGASLRVTLVLETEDSAALVEQLEAVGVDVVSAYKDRVNISVAIALIEQALAAEDVKGVFQQLTEIDHVIAVRLPGQRSSDMDDPQPAPDRHGQTTEGEGVGVINADAWHQAGFTGAGIRIGVLDLGFSGYEELLGSELPASVEMATFGWYDDEEVHGTACAEIVHEVAPGAELFLAWYDGSDAAMGEAVDWLVSHDVQIITHSAGGAVSPRDGTGWDARLVDATTARGILWVNSAGNEADVHYREDFSDIDGDGFHDYAHGSSLLPIQIGGYLRVFLIWQDDWDYPTQDYELVILDGEGQILAKSEEAQDGSPGQQPAEYLALEVDDPIVYAAVYAYDIDQPTTFDVFAAGPGVGVVGAVPAYSVTAPGDAQTSLTVGAVAWADDALEYYSSQGPTNDGRLKPEISGPTRVSGYTYGDEGFDGTSASTPHIAGAAALVWEAYPALTREALFDYLINATRDLGPGGPDTGYGFGRLDLPDAPLGVIGGPTPTPGIASVPDPGGSTFATSTPAVPVVPTPVAFATPEPQEEPRKSIGSLLVALVVLAGFGLGGGGLLLIGGILLVVDLRSRRKGDGLGARPPSRPARPAVSSPAQQPVARQAQTPPAAPGASLGATQIWMSGPDASGPVPAVAPTPAPIAVMGPVPGPVPNAPPQTDADSAEAASAVDLRCPSCNAPVRRGARFCPTCGQRLDDDQAVRTCAACGARLSPDSRFCTECGKPV